MMDIGMLALLIGLTAAMLGLLAWCGKQAQEGREER